MSAQRVNRKRYSVKKVYVIICRTCNEDITRAQSGEEPETRDEAETAIHDHERVWHPGAEYQEADEA